MLGAYVLQGRLQNGGAVPIPYQAEVTPVVRKVFPQGWAFFTKPATSEALVPYRTTPSGMESVSVGEYAEPSNVFGFDRRKRRQGVEAALLLNGIGRTSWEACAGRSIEACAAAAPAEVARTNRVASPTLCGHVVMAAERVTPWKWRNLRAEPRYVSEALRLNVTC
jgi:antimicrobial peptide system SdpA family protein